MSDAIKFRPSSRVAIFADPYPEDAPGLFSAGIWPAAWVSLPGNPEPPVVVAYRCSLNAAGEETLRIHVTADEHYELFLDGAFLSRGPERGDPNNWFFDTYDVHLGPGAHVLSARVWSPGVASPRWRLSLRHGLLVSPQNVDHQSRIATGHAPWEALAIPGYTFTPPFEHDFYSIGHTSTVDAAQVPRGAERGAGHGWTPVETLQAGANPDRRNRFTAIHLLRPAIVPPRIERECRPGKVQFVGSLIHRPDKDHPFLKKEHLGAEAEEWQALWDQNRPLVIPAQAHLRVLIDLDDYYCGYPFVLCSGGQGASLRFAWAEALYNRPGAPEKGNRNEWWGKCFWGIGDTLLPSGRAGQRFDVPHPYAGRYLEITVRTDREAVTLERIGIRETRYPLDVTSSFKCSDDRLNALMPLCTRTVALSAHDAGVDGPYYECMSWIGDAPQLCLSLYTLTTDDRLARKYIDTFNASRQQNGLTLARYPARDRVYIASYSLCWIRLIHDFMLWRGDMDLLRRVMPGVRGVLDAWLRFCTPDGLARITLGWNFVDWVPEWPDGIPPGGRGHCSIHNWQGVLALQSAAELEDWLDEPECAARHRRLARALTGRIIDRFWNEARSGFADDEGHLSFSEHSQSLALCSRDLPRDLREKTARTLIHDANLTRTTFSFRHYLFEALATLNRGDIILQRLAPWLDLPGQGFKTVPEQPEPSRSDCHGWSAHPAYHVFAGLLGIRPAAPGFTQVVIKPSPGPLQHIEGVLPHPAGPLGVACEQGDGRLSVTCSLPSALTGTLVLGDRAIPLHSGIQTHEGTARE